MSVRGTFETCRRTLKRSAYGGRPEVIGTRSERRDLPRLHERRAEGLVGAWLRVIGARLRLPVRPDRVAMPAVYRDTAGPRRGLDPVLRERARGLGREQAPTAGNQG